MCSTSTPLDQERQSQVTFTARAANSLFAGERGDQVCFPVRYVAQAAHDREFWEDVAAETNDMLMPRSPLVDGQPTQTSRWIIRFNAATNCIMGTRISI